VRELMMELNVGPFHVASHNALDIVWEKYKYYVLVFILGTILVMVVIILWSRKK
jgi:hypothetical protein